MSPVSSASTAIAGPIAGTEELLRYNYDENDPDSRQVRLIIRLDFSDRTPLILKFKNEKDVTAPSIESQCGFSEHLAGNGIPAARFYRAGERFVLRNRRRYAVQGDISDCNLFLTGNGEVGMFDFNRCGDNILFCDAVMQGVFEARLMDYDHELTEEE